jgi:Bacterial Ig domain
MAKNPKNKKVALVIGLGLGIGYLLWPKKQSNANRSAPVVQRSNNSTVYSTGGSGSANTPTIPSTPILMTNPITNATTALQYTATAGSTITVTQNGTVIGTGVVPASGIVNITVALTAGASITATATNATGTSAATAPIVVGSVPIVNYAIRYEESAPSSHLNPVLSNVNGVLRITDSATVNLLINRYTLSGGPGYTTLNDIVEPNVLYVLNKRSTNDPNETWYDPTGPHATLNSELIFSIQPI